jgi:hypothetical protein
VSADRGLPRYRAGQAPLPPGSTRVETPSTPGAEVEAPRDWGTPFR